MDKYVSITQSELQDIVDLALMNHSSLQMSECVSVGKLIVDMTFDRDILARHRDINENNGT